MIHPPLRIGIDPELAAIAGPEVAWSWRTLLAGMGYAWAECPLDGTPLDIAYVCDQARAPAAGMVICADPARWRSPGTQRLADIGQEDGWEFPRYHVELIAPPLLRRTEGRAVIGRDLIFDMFWLLSGQDEGHHPRGAHGYSELEDSATLRSGLLRRALASGIAHQIEILLESLGHVGRLPRWPGGKRAAAAGSHDVDYPEVIRWLEPLRIVARQGAGGLPGAADVSLGRRHHWHFASWTRLEQSLGARSAFYFVARKGSLREYASGTPDSFYDIRRPRFRRLFAELTEAGCEVGLHASYNAYRDPDTFRAERDALSEASGQEVVGNRHHYWHLDPQNPEATLLLHEQIGLRYDSSLVHDRYLGWRRGSSLPFYPFHQGLRRALGTLQLPTSWMDDHLFGHRARNPGERAALLGGLVDTVAAQGGCLIVDVHDYVYDEVLFPGWAATYRDLLATLAGRGDIWMATPRMIAAHWADRQATLERASSGLSDKPVAALTLA